MQSRELLVIDDEDTIRRALCAYLREKGYTVYSTADGQTSLQLLKEHPGIRVVLSDIRIPGMDGFEILRQIKLIEPLTQVILMTAYSDTNLAIQALRLGADDYLEKPFHLEVLGEILERALNRRRLEALSRRWRKFLEHLPIGMIICSADGRIEGITPVAQSLLDCHSQKAVGQLLWKLPGMDGTEVLFANSPERTGAAEVVVCGNELVVQPLDSALEGDTAQRVLILTDVTEEKALQRELAVLSADLETKVAERTRGLTSELEFTHRLLDTAGVLIVVMDRDGRVLRLNKFAEELTRFTVAEAQRAFSSFVEHPESPLSVIFDPRATEDLSSIIAELPTRDGTKRILSWSTRDLPSRAGHGGRLIIGVDMTEQKQLEAKLQSSNLQLERVLASRSMELRQKNAQLIHSARLASLGEIAAGIAHEMKQPLNVISITADLIKLLHKNRTLTDELLLSNLDKIRHTVDRMATTINHLRGFLHIDSANFTDVSIPQAVDGALSILGDQIRLDGIDIVAEIPRDLPFVLGELNQIEQVLVNLMQNARDAIEEKVRRAEQNGRSFRGMKRLTLRADTRADGRELIIEVSDTGIGISREVKQRIFEPFFTTKEADRGTGLGLSISMNIVQSHGGVMELESTLGKGTTFRIIFPVMARSEEGQ